MIVLPRSILLATATLQIGVNGQFNGAKAALYTSNVTPNRNSVLADFTIGDFGGLTNLKSVVWGTPTLNDQSQAQVRAAVLSWLTLSAPTEETTAYGYVLTNGAGDTLLAAERFAAPFLFSIAGQELAFAPRLVFDC